MKNAPLGTARDADKQQLGEAESVPFRVVALRSVSYGSKIAEFSIETPIGVVEADLFSPEGREPFVQPRSVRDKYSGEWRRTVTLDRDFAKRILDALCAQKPGARETRAEREPQRSEPSDVLLESERRFDAAFAELGAGDGAS